MLRIPYETLRSVDFSQGLSKLAAWGGYKNQKTAYDVSKIYKKCLAEHKIIEDLWVKLVKQYARLDDKGECVPQQGIPGTFCIADDKIEEFSAKRKEFDALEVEVDWRHIRLADCEGAGLTPAQMAALDCVLTFADLTVAESAG